jgi:hypothetical protein
MPSLYRARIDALLAAHTALMFNDRIVITDLDALIHAIGDLIDECIKERIQDVYRERNTD